MPVTKPRSYVADPHDNAMKKLKVMTNGLHRRKNGQYRPEELQMKLNQGLLSTREGWKASIYNSLA